MTKHKRAKRRAKRKRKRKQNNLSQLKSTKRINSSTSSILESRVIEAKKQENPSKRFEYPTPEELNKKPSKQEIFRLLMPLISMIFAVFFLVFFAYSLGLLTSGNYFHLKSYGSIGHLGHSTITFILLIGTIFWVVIFNNSFNGRKP